MSPPPSLITATSAFQQSVGEDHRCRHKSRQNGRPGSGKSVFPPMTFRFVSSRKRCLLLRLHRVVVVVEQTRPTNNNWAFLSRLLFRFKRPQLRELHGQGYSLLSIDATGQTALHYGARFGHKDIVRYLISYAPKTIINMLDNETWVENRFLCCSGGMWLWTGLRRNVSPGPLSAPISCCCCLHFCCD